MNCRLSYFRSPSFRPSLFHSKYFFSLTNCFCLVTALLISPGCAYTSALPEEMGTGPKPQLPSPVSTVLPTVNIARAIGWKNGQKPSVAPGLKVEAYAINLDHPRWLYVLPNGDILVAETNSPAKKDANAGIKGFVMKQVMKAAGAGPISADRLTLLRGVEPNGKASLQTVFLKNLHSPFGMALVGSDFYVANTDAILRFDYAENSTSLQSASSKLADLPAGMINHHWTKNIIASQDGQYLYATVGSNSNAAENGIENEKNRAAIYKIDLKTGESTVFADGLRNPNGLSWEPKTGALWTTVNERDELGNDLVPDYMTAVKPGGFYGWPYSYYGNHVDSRVTPTRPDLVAKALMPDYALGAHTASLGLVFYEGENLPAKYKGGAFIAQHGSWNRKPHSGYKVVFVPFVNGHPAGPPQTILSDFLNPENQAQGRPVGIAIDSTGALLVADDVGNVIWRISQDKAFATTSVLPNAAVKPAAGSNPLIVSPE